MTEKAKTVLKSLGIETNQSGCAIGKTWTKTTGRAAAARSPIDGATLANVTWASTADVEKAIDAAAEAFKRWREVPAPRRGEFVRRIGVKLRERKADLATLVSLEAGKITQEALGEVQE